MAFREPLNNMLCDDTSVHTGLSWARIVLTFCSVWMSHTCSGLGGGEEREDNASALRGRTETVPVSNRGGYSRWWCSLRSRCTACSCGQKNITSQHRGKALLICNRWWCSGFMLKGEKKEKNKTKHSVTLVCTVPTRCHRDPQVSSGICKWCRCPTPMGGEDTDGLHSGRTSGLGSSNNTKINKKWIDKIKFNSPDLN